MGIDDKKYASLPATPEVKKDIELIKDSFKNTKLVLTIDRLDYSKGILQRLQAFEHLLQEYPEYKEKIALYMVVVPSRDTVPQYAQLRDQIDKKVGTINSVHRTMDWDTHSLLLPLIAFGTAICLIHHCRCLPGNPHARWYEPGK